MARPGADSESSVRNSVPTVGASNRPSVDDGAPRLIGLLYRILQASSQSAANYASDGMAVATLQGPRPDNQDRVLIALLGSTDGNPHNNLACFVVADGIATLTNGAQCAAVAISAFIAAMLAEQRLPIEQRASTALAYANVQCFRRFKGRSGTTLSAAIISSTNLVIANAGDSRVYGISGGSQLERLTVDDSMNERLAGHADIDPQYASSKGLLQYVGMGEGFSGSVDSHTAPYEQLLLTSDGFNAVPIAVMTGILRNADARRASQRLLNLATWLGPVDNTTLAIARVSAAIEGASSLPRGASHFITPTSANYIYFTDFPGELNSLAQARERERTTGEDPKGAPREGESRQHPAVQVEIQQS